MILLDNYILFLVPNIPKVPLKLQNLWSSQFYNFCEFASDQNSPKLCMDVCIYIYTYVYIYAYIYMYLSQSQT